MRRLPNGYGGVSKYSGKRKNPYRAWIPSVKYYGGTTAPFYYKDVEKIADVVDSMKFTNKQFEKDIKALILKYSQEDIRVERKKITLGYFPTRAEALNALAEYNRMPIDAEMKNMTFSQIWETIKPKIYSTIKDHSANAYETGYKRCMPIYNKRLASIKTSDMQKCVDAVVDTTPSVQHNIIMVCKAVFNYAMENDIVVKDYSQLLTITPYEKETRTPYSNDEIRAILNNKDWEYSTSRKTKLTGHKVARTLIILLYTGIRINELLGVKKEHIHLDERYIEVYGTKTKNAERIVPIHKDIMHLMDCENYLIEDANGKRMSYNSYNNSLMPRFIDEMSMKHNIHETRHTFVSKANACGLNQVLLHKMIGHSSKDITERVYTHAYVEDLVREIDKFKLI